MSVTTTQPRSRVEKNILFVCASDTLVRLLVPIARQMRDRGHVVTLAKLRFTDERAEFAMAQCADGLLYVGTVNARGEWLSAFDGVVMGNDWGREIRALIHLCNAWRIPTFCVQESVINFEGPQRRMRHAAYALVQGEVSARHLADRNNVEVVGNPRYEELAIQQAPAAHRALINCNFTYGVEESNREAWISAAVQACRRAGVEATILQHPRDRSDLSRYGCAVVRSNAGTIHQLLLTGSLLISRFSSVIHEAIALGRPAVYFDPFDETGGYDFSPDGRALQRATDGEQLERAISALRSRPVTIEEMQTYLGRHIRPHAERPSVMCARRIEALLHTPWVPGALAGRRWRSKALLGYCMLEQAYVGLR